MKNKATLCITGISAAMAAIFGVMIHQATHVEAIAKAGVGPETTQFMCSIVEDLTDKGEVKSCCWDGSCARFSVRPF